MRKTDNTETDGQIEARQDFFGHRIAEILGVKKSPIHPDRYQTEWGDKTAIGLYLSVRRLILEIEKNNDSVMLS